MHTKILTERKLQELPKFFECIFYHSRLQPNVVICVYCSKRITLQSSNLGEAVSHFQLSKSEKLTKFAIFSSGATTSSRLSWLKKTLLTANTAITTIIVTKFLLASLTAFA